jgi:ERCC4-type nuclease
MAVQLFVDTREPESIKTALVQSTATGAGAGAVLKALPVGDFWIGAGADDGVVESLPPSPAVVVERKTVADLLASLTDGRFRHQRQRMLDLNPGKVVYVLEGAPSRDPRVQGALENLVLRHGCFILPSAGVDQTCSILRNMHRKLALAAATPVAQPAAAALLPAEPAKPAAALLSKARVDAAQRARVGGFGCLLLSIPGVSMRHVAAIQGVYARPLDLITDAGKKLDAVQVTAQRKLGPVLAQRIRDAFLG